jgi:hypothetical protein
MSRLSAIGQGEFKDGDGRMKLLKAVDGRMEMLEVVDVLSSFVLMLEPLNMSNFYLRICFGMSL